MPCPSPVTHESITNAVQSSPVIRPNAKQVHLQAKCQAGGYMHKSTTLANMAMRDPKTSCWRCSAVRPGSYIHKVTVAQVVLRLLLLVTLTNARTDAKIAKPPEHTTKLTTAEMHANQPNAKDINAMMQ